MIILQNTRVKACVQKLEVLLNIGGSGSSNYSAPLNCYHLNNKKGGKQ
tara:strand:- start:166 stop:309 length:144 start_codon:yes stop_codon:yes gene_type:complete